MDRKSDCFFSVIIPCYNCAATVRQTVASVAGQSFRDLEILLIDDGSRDETLSVLRELEKTAQVPVRVYAQENRGVSAARNCGIRSCSGHYILFLDADDMLAEGLLQTLADALKADPADTVCYLRTSVEGELTPIGPDAKVCPVTVDSLLRRLTFVKKNVGFTCFVYDGEILRSRQLQFAEGVRYGEDWEFTTKYLAWCRTAAMLDRNGYFYRIVPNSATRTVVYAQTDTIGAARRTYAYLAEMGHPFAGEFGEYMYPRAAFSVAHRFGKARNRELYDRFRREYDLKDVMGRMVKNPNVDRKSKLAAAAYLVSPRLYFLISKF